MSIIRRKRLNKLVTLKRGAKSGLSILSISDCLLVREAALKGHSIQTISYMYSITMSKARKMIDRANGSLK